MQRFTKHWSWLLLAILVGCGVWLRLIDIGRFPPGLTTDEAAITYDAWGLSIDGTDQWGQQWPIIFTSLGDGKLPLTHYVLTLGFRVFGFHLYGIRILAAVCGIILIVATYFLAKRWQPNNALFAVLAAGLICFSPWTIHFSRFGLEAGIAVMLTTLGLVYLYHNPPLGTLFLALAPYTYHSSLIVSPLLFLTALLLQKIMPNRKKIVYIVLFGLLLSPLIFAETQSGWDRANQTLALPNSLPDGITRIMAQFSPDFWMWGKQPNYRQAIPGSFVLLMPEIVLLMFGVIASFWLPRHQKIFMIVWFVGGLIPSLIGTPSPHSIRAFHLAPLVVLLEAEGFVWLTRRLRYLSIFMVIWYVISWGGFWSTYTGKYISLAATDYGYGYDQVMKTLRREGSSTSTFVISPFLDQPYLYTLLYWRISPPEFRAGGLANMTYKPIHWPEPKTGALYAGSAAEIPPSDPRVIMTVPYPHTTVPLWVIAR